MKKLTGSVRTIDRPVECPSKEEITKAVNILSNQATAIYQILYANGFAEPGNHGKFRISRDSYNDSCGLVGYKIYIVPKDKQHKHYGFYVETPDEALEKVQLVDKAIEKKLTKCNDYACCPLAAHRPCVCIISFTCPLHGKAQCHGSHD